MLDFELAQLYGIQTRVLKQAVRRNIERFEGEDFMFELTESEYNSLMLSSRSRFVTLNEGRGSNIKYAPWAFTELGVAMLSSVLRSDIAISINRNIMRAFVYMRNQIAATSVVTAELEAIREKIKRLERGEQDTIEAVNDLSEDIRKDLDNIYLAIGALSAKTLQAHKPRRPIGYQHLNKESNE